ncbi:microfibril-associated glycoprotein 4-like [Mercenaria mercenaria]|uniref:microfibril-associated glycoprotein 4-like n=1 Tax=Mercenaria mercenaria TaxID=6596 RepID=UPI00234E7977|nr:microfibril-associated glycoprotein 4-like [Mercenaria mercenaria]
MKCTFLFVCLLTFAAVWNFISSVDIIFRKYDFDSYIAGYRCIPNETAFEVENIPNLPQCGRLCHLNNMCLSYSYKPDSYKCIGCRVNLGIKASSYESYPGSLYFQTKTFSETSCKEILENNPSTTSGLYKVKLSESKKIPTVYCDMDTNGGGWTVLQNRFNGSVDFFRNFSEYENGFGALNGEFWLGLKIVHEMTYQGTTEFRLDIALANGRTFTETYQNFYLDKGPHYTLHLGEPGSTHTVFGYSNGQHFTTYDFDQDRRPTHNCAVNGNGAWWFNECSKIHLNGIYGMSVNYYENHSIIHDMQQVKTTKMMFR